MGEHAAQEPPSNLSDAGSGSLYPTTSSPVAPVVSAADLAYYRALDLAQAKAGFLARTAHELRSPINTVISLHQLILEGLCDSPEEEHEFLLQSDLAARKMLGLLDELIKFSKLEIGRLQPQYLVTEVHEVMEAVYQQTRLHAADRNVRWRRHDIPKTLYVLTDANWLQQALTNLVHAAIAQPSTTSIQVQATTAVESAEVMIWLDDNRSDIAQQDVLASLGHPILMADSMPQAEDTPQNRASASAIDWSPTMSLWLAHQILAALGGRLEVIALDTTHDDTTLVTYTTRLQCVLPLASADDA